MKHPKSVLFRLSFLSAVVAMHLATCAQSVTPIPHTLLWRISGKGLQKPSYLYGTMHLNDKRLFLFGDSVYHAIENTEGLAIEVNPDEMAAYMVNKMFDQIENGKKLQDLLDKKYFDSHRKALAKKFHKPADEISASDVVKEKNKWMGEYMRNGEMPTFVDAYLYNIARRQGKWLGGIEDISDQAGLMSDLVDQSDVNNLLEPDNTEGNLESSMTEKMIRIYTNQDLEGVQAFMMNQSPEQKDRLLLHRNVKMALRIDSLSARRSMFFAIGCAHLPGDSGVIDLLRRKGFSVDPVFSVKKIASANYIFQEVHIPWTSVTDEQGTYTAEMPANPATVKLYGVLEMKFLMDLFNMSGFCTMSVVNPGHSGSKDSLFKSVAGKMFHGGVPAGKSLVKNGIPGREYIHYDSTGNIRLQMFVDSNRVYMALLSAIKKDVLLSADAEKFFQSYTITGVATPLAGSTSTRFTDSMIGVSFTSPVGLTYNKKMSKSDEESYDLSTYTGIDQKTGAMIMMLSRTLKPGYHLTDLSGAYESMENVFTSQYTHLKKDSAYLDSVKLMRYSGQNIAEPQIYVSAATMVKGGKLTMLMVISDSSDKSSPALQEVFHSFRLIPYAAPRWSSYESPDHAFSFYGPTPAIQDFYNKDQRWVSFDPTTATSYTVVPVNVGKYLWYTSDSAFWKSWIGEDTAQEELMELRDVVNGNVAAKEYLVRSKTNNMACSRTRLLISGEKGYQLFAFGEPQLMKSPEVNRFFDSFRIVNATPSTVTQSKAGLLLHDLESRDSTTLEEAYQALSDAPFEKKDGPLLREALFKLYRSGVDTSLRTEVNIALARALADLDDTASVNYVRASYPGLVREKEPLRNVALALLARQHTSYSYGALAELLRQGPILERIDYGAIDALQDSLALTAGIYPSLLPWARDTLHASVIARIVLSLADSGYLSKEKLTSVAGDFVGPAKALLPGLRIKEYYDDYYVSNLLTLIGHLHAPAAYSLLKSYQSAKSLNLVAEAVTQLLEGQQTASPAALRRLAESPSFRISLYDDLKRLHKTALFPAQYLTQPAFALAAIYSVTDEEEDDEDVHSVTFLSKKTATYHGKPYVFYLYKVTYGGDDEPVSYMGIAGGYDPAGTGLKPKKDITGVYKKEAFDEHRTGNLLKAYLKWLDE